MLEKIGVMEESIERLDEKRKGFRERNKLQWLGVGLMYTIMMGLCFFAGLYINYLFAGRLLLQMTGNLIGLMGPAGDMVYIGFGLMIGCVFFSFLAPLLSRGERTYLQEVGRYLYNMFFVTYVVLLIFVLYGRSMVMPDIGLSGIQLVPFVEIWDLIMHIYHHTINLPYAYALLFGNIILFVPLAFLLRPHFKTGLACFRIMLMIFILVEIMQLITGRGIFDIDDIIKYSLGVPLGFWLRKLVDRRRN